MPANDTSIRISKESARKLKIYCAKHGKTMKEVLEKLIKELEK